MNKKISCSEEHLVYHIKNFLKNSDKLRMKMKDFKLKNGVVWAPDFGTTP